MLSVTRSYTKKFHDFFAQKNLTLNNDWKGEFVEVLHVIYKMLFTQNHETRCDYIIVDCDNKSCMERKPRCEMATHVQEQCLFRKVGCPHCNNNITYCLLQVRWVNQCHIDSTSIYNSIIIAFLNHFLLTRTISVNVQSVLLAAQMSVKRP